MEDNNVDVSENIKNEISSSDVVLFMKGTPAFPMCGFSATVVQLLSDLGVKFSSVNVLESDEIRDFLNDREIKDILKKNESIENLNQIYENNFK